LPGWGIGRQGRTLRLIGCRLKGDESRLEFPDLFRQEGGVLPGPEAHYAESVTEAAAYLECLLTYGTRAAKDGDLLQSTIHMT
jgi:hypothetical protein